MLYWKEGAEDRSMLKEMMCFVEFTREFIKVQDKQALSKVFQIIEDFIVYGDEDVDYAASMGFLEDIINSSGHNPEELPYSSYIPLLGTESRDFCRELDRFWGSRTPGLWTDEEIKSGTAPPEASKEEKPINTNRVPCPVCGHLSFYETAFPGSMYICNQCDWVDDKNQYENPNLVLGANQVSLNKARENYRKYNFSKPRGK